MRATGAAADDAHACAAAACCGCGCGAMRLSVVLQWLSLLAKSEKQLSSKLLHQSSKLSHKSSKLPYQNRGSLLPPSMGCCQQKLSPLLQQRSLAHAKAAEALVTRAIHALLFACIYFFRPAAPSPAPPPHMSEQSSFWSSACDSVVTRDLSELLNMLYAISGVLVSRQRGTAPRMRTL